MGLFLLYHYFDREMYNLIRVFIAAYVWMTGYGNFSYYYVKKDFTATRLADDVAVEFLCLRDAW